MAEGWRNLSTGSDGSEQNDVRNKLLSEIACSPTCTQSPGSATLLPHEPTAGRLAPAKGSYYLKETSSFWKWDGIDTVVRLGAPALDPKRTDPDGTPLDGFGIYLGGHGSGREVDAGLTWSVVANKDGFIDSKHFGWRPFYRTTEWHSPSAPNLYWSPGETVEMSLHTIGKNKLELRIADPGPHPRRVIVRDFEARGFSAGGDALFKRVDSIDQVHNEGRAVKPSHSSVVRTGWLSAFLLHSAPRSDELVPFTPERRASIAVPSTSVVRHSGGEDQDSVGGESVDIYANPADKPY